MLRLSLRWTLCLFLLPLLLLQALWCRSRVARLPEADYPDRGRFGEANDHCLSVLGLGDSVIAGVGCKSLEEAITAQLASCLHKERGIDVQWKASGENGARLEDLLNHLALLPSEFKPDLVLVSIGVNDVTRLTSLLKWQLLVTRLVADLKEKFSCHMVLLGVPPMDLFTGLPQPLRFTLGIRAAMLDIALKRTGDLLDDVTWISPPLGVEEGLLAEDGYHPSCKACEQIAIQIEKQIPTLTTRCSDDQPSRVL